MNKKAKRRAFFIFFLVCIMYVSVMANLHDRFGFRRVTSMASATPQGMNIFAPKPVPPETKKISHELLKKESREERKSVQGELQGQKHEVLQVVQKKQEKEKITTVNVENAPQVFKAKVQGPDVALFISLPIISYACRQKWIEADGLMLTSKSLSGKPEWKKPLDILKEKDIGGLESMARAIGKEKLINFLKKEGIHVDKSLNAEEIILGKGFSVDERVLLSLYGKYVTGDLLQLLPYRIENRGIVHTKNGFQFMESKRINTVRYEEDTREWRVPNLADLPMKAAIEKLSPYTSKVKVYGSGTVNEQHPHAFERVQGEVECAIYGRTYKQ